MDDIDMALPYDILVRVVSSLNICSEPPQPEPQLPRREHLVIDLPDREVRIASTRSSTLGADRPPVDAEHGHRDDEHRADPKLHDQRYSIDPAMSGPTLRGYNRGIRKRVIVGAVVVAAVAVAVVVVRLRARGAPHPGLDGALRARELFYADRPAEALTEAKRWFDTDGDALARQVVGAVHVEAGRFTEALPLLERALDQHLGAGDHAEASRDAQWLAATHGRTGRFAEALEAAEISVREAKLASSARLQHTSNLAYGKILSEIGDADEARAALRLAQQHASTHSERAWAALQIGILASEIGASSDAVDILGVALEQAVANKVSHVENAARLNLARAHRDLGALDAAEAQLRALGPEVLAKPTAQFVDGLVAADRGEEARARELLDRAERGAPTDDYAIDIALQRGRIAERAGDLAAAEAHYRRAIERVEQLRRDTARRELRPWVLEKRREPYAALLDVLARGDTANRARWSEALAIAEQRHARTWLDALIDRPGATTVLDRARARAELERRLRTDPAARAVPPGELLAMLRGKEALVFSANPRSGGWRFHIVDGEIAALDRMPDDVWPLTEEWAAPAKRTPALAMQLGDLLVPPAARARTERPLYLVATGALAGVPFAALRPGGQTLVETRAHVRLPGLVALRCRAGAPSSTSAIFLGDSDGSLPNARVEVTELAPLHGARLLLGADATFERLLQGRGAALAHLAVHADATARGGGLTLANRRVAPADIVEHGIGPRLAVLAGCATAASRDAEGWGALSSAFLVAGSGSVVATLEPVGDHDALEVMRRFYPAGGARRPAEALAIAQRELLKVDWHPRWGSFVVYGAGDACSPPPDRL